ncbi:hypothetical protein [Bacillus wiedmannii]|uniref:hypothetical protein n=1 Tax=Bacillus wiedmannii TaxID=1890302 RepID=UPI002E1FE875|nr:hypothetical protein [Bacillus wiedmannii]
MKSSHLDRQNEEVISYDGFSNVYVNGIFVLKKLFEERDRYIVKGIIKCVNETWQ